jgi:Protein of unknown function (DUF2695)
VQPKELVRPAVDTSPLDRPSDRTNAERRDGTMRGIFDRRALAAPILALLAFCPWVSGATPDQDLPDKEGTPMKELAELATAIRNQLMAVGFPETEVKVEPWREDPSRKAVSFISASFTGLYPEQRFHRLIHALPDDFVSQHLSGSVWFELAPGERPEDLWYADEDEVASVAPGVMRALEESGFFAALDDVMSPADSAAEREGCHGDFQISKRILAQRQIPQLGDLDMTVAAHHVFMSKGAFCDCEILLNVYQNSRMARELRQTLSEQMERREE